MAEQSLAVVVPVYNEEEGIEHFAASLLSVLDGLPLAAQILFVNDGSTDGTRALLDRVQAARPTAVSVIHLSRNFGHQAALTAGMDYADADAVICMDADMQHPPAMIPDLVARWREGYDVVQTVKTRNEGIGFLKQLATRASYAIINSMSTTHIEPNASDFRLLSRRVVDIFRKDLRERDRFLRGLVTWVGFAQCLVPFDAPPRYAGAPKYTLRRLANLARVGLISFSRIPLKVAVIFGFFVSALSIAYGIFAVIAQFVLERRIIEGWTSSILVTTFLGGCQLIFLGILGEYIAAIFDEIKARPIYIVGDTRLREGYAGPPGTDGR